ncbi:uncharacterized protein RCC_01464 [Ramularia collo-cygni]|uniref:Uncharacterized protein n=1 Tax=Ramularia collo-cygni TaxID=112498 RepID=A0A2D3V286_9PEZI|nr:uncharacterized protein RCC_01464 [Ramularia collo-cygni]CZT15619.1 uncharacterized protein RCC_01464 [Ramularia collo-cygni]
MKLFFVVAALSMASGVFAGLDCGGYCQCLFDDGSHCCVDTTYGGSGATGGVGTKVGEDCQARCSSRQRGSDGAACGGAGKWSCVSAWNGQFRSSCKPDWTT